MDSALEVRRRSAALFGNEKLAEVIKYVSNQETPVTAQIVATGTSINYSLVRDALRKMVGAGLVVEIPRLGGSRSALYYRAIDGPVWRLVVALVTELELASSGVSSRTSDMKFPIAEL